MTSDQSHTFLKQTLSQIMPDVFFHPVWVYFARNLPTYPPDYIQQLLLSLHEEPLTDDFDTQCQVIFLCAYLQSRQGEHATAMAEVEKVWKFAETNGLYHTACSAAWIAGALNAQNGNYPEAINWLGSLQEHIAERQEWVLMGVLELFKQTLEAKAFHSTDLLDWFLRWGEWPLEETASLSRDSSNTEQSASTKVDLITLVLRHSTSIWGSIKSKIVGRRFWQKSQSSKELDQRAVLKNVDLSKVDKSIRLNQNVSPSTSTHLTHRSQLPSTASQTSPTDTLFLIPPSGSKQIGQRTLAVYCLGSFQVYQDEQLVENWLSRKALSVFKYLILEHPNPVAKEILMDKFWPDSDPESARRNLHQAIYALRQILRGDQAEFNHIYFKNDCYTMNPDLDMWIDFQEFEKCINAGRRQDKSEDVDKAIEQYEIAEELYQGDFLEEDLYEDWPILRREQLCRSYFDLVDRLTGLYLQTGQYTSATYLCHKVLAKDRCYEAAHRLLMQCYLAQGQRHMAVRQYQTCMQALREDLGIQPTRETVELYHRIASKYGV